MRMHLTEWASLRGVHPHTAYRWFQNGTLPVPATRVGPRTGLVNPDAITGKPGLGLGLYARVSSHDQKSDLDAQVARLTEWASSTGQVAVRVEAEVGSGMNGHRSKLRRLLSDPRATTWAFDRR